MQYTPNYNLAKPEENEAAEIDMLNQNADKIDAELLEINNQLNSIPDKASSAEALAGTDDVKYMTPVTTKEAVLEHTPKPALGSLKFQAQPDPGEGWALCNGAPFFESDSPLLFSILEPDPGHVWESDYSGGSSTTNFQLTGSVVTSNGYCFATGTSHDGSYYYPAVKYRTPDGTTQHVFLSTSSTYRDYFVVDVCWDGTQFIALVMKQTSGASVYLFKSTNGTSWNEMTTGQISGNCSSGRVKYENGLYTIWYCNVSGYPTVAYSQILTSTTWASVVVYSISGTFIKQAYWTGTRWELLIATSNAIYRFYRSDFMGGFTLGGSTTNAARGLVALCNKNLPNEIIYENGVYVATGQGSSNAAFIYSSDFTTWTKVELTAPGASATYYALYEVGFSGDYYVFSAYNYIYYMKVLGGTATWIYYGTVSSQMASTGAKLGYNRSTKEVVLISSHVSTNMAHTFATKRPCLPVIDMSGSYAFIKSAE